MKTAVVRRATIIALMLLSLIVPAPPPREADAQQPVQGPVNVNGAGLHDVELVPPVRPLTTTKPLHPVPLPARRTGRTPQLVPNETYDAHVLVLSTDGQEAALPAIIQSLVYIGVPYTLHIAVSNTVTLTQGFLADGSHGKFQGIILAVGDMSYTPDGGQTYKSALTDEEWQNLWDYEANFGIRQIGWYTYPTIQYGWEIPTAIDTTLVPYPMYLTGEGRQEFGYVNASSPISLTYSYTFLAHVTTTLPSEIVSVTSLLTDTKGNALAIITHYADGRDVLNQSFDSNAALPHMLTLSYGLINWVTKGLFLGERHVYLSAHIDDYFIPNVIYDPASTGGNPKTYRVAVNDMAAIAVWQAGRGASPVTPGFRLDLAFNAYGARFGNTDPLVPWTAENQSIFKWINHTYSHNLLDGMPAAMVSAELRRNFQAASDMHLSTFSRLNLVTPGITGLRDRTAMSFAFTQGVRYLVSDASFPDQLPKTPNTGLNNFVQPDIFMIPRRPNNLFYNVSTPDEWVTEYNAFYEAFFGKTSTYQEILDREAQVLLLYMLKGEVYPWMFHQSNMRTYDGTHSILGDLLDRTAAKYSTYFSIPALSPTMEDLGLRVVQRTSLAEAGVTATIEPGRVITLTAQREATIPITGMHIAGAEQYGGQWISNVKIRPGRTVVMPLDDPSATFREEDAVWFVPSAWAGR